MSCSVCGEKKRARCKDEFKTRVGHRCKDYEVWPWEVTKSSLQKMLHAGVGLPEDAFQRPWDAAGTVPGEEEEPEAGPSYSSSDDETIGRSL